jgi:hypothetical protein
MNPARSLAPAVLEGRYGALWVYVVGPLAGAAAAALLVRAAGVRTLTAKLVPDARYRSTMRTWLPAKNRVVPVPPDRAA